MVTTISPPTVAETADVEVLAADLQRRVMLLMQELEKFETHLKEIKRDGLFQFGDFKKSVQNELRHLEKILTGSIRGQKAARAVCILQIGAHTSSIAMLIDIRSTHLIYFQTGLNPGNLAFQFFFHKISRLCYYHSAYN